MGRAAALRRSSSARTGSRSAAWLGKNLVTTLQPLRARRVPPQRCKCQEHPRATEVLDTLAERILAEHYACLPARCLWVRVFRRMGGHQDMHSQ